MTSRPKAPVDAATRESEVHWPTALQFGFSAFAWLSLWTTALSVAAYGLFELLNPNTSPSDAASQFLIATGSFLSGLLLIPSVGYSFARLLDREIALPAPLLRLGKLFRPTSIFVIFPFIFAAGAWVSRQDDISWFGLPPLHFLAVSLPILWLVLVSIRKLPSGSGQRIWGVFASGLVLGPAVILVFETVIVLGFAIAFGVFLFNNPGIQQQLETLSVQLEQGTTPDPEILGEYITFLYGQPGFFIGLLLLLSVFVPLIEELFKPVAVWLLAGSRLTPGGGFVAGVVSGAAFALFENLGYVSEVDSWSTLVLARIGTAIMHMVTAGLTGWALAKAWQDRSYLRLGFAYLAAVVIHGIWNAIAILYGIASLPVALDIPPYLPSHLIVSGPPLFALLTASLFFLLILYNRRLQPAGAQA